MNMKLLAVVTPPYIYHSFSTRKMFLKEIFTPVKMKCFGCLNIRKHRESNNGEKYITLDTSLKFGRLDRIKITSS